MGTDAMHAASRGNRCGPASSGDPWQWDAISLAAAYRTGRLTPVDVWRSIEARKEAVDPTLHAIVHWDGVGALAQARASERRFQQGRPLSPMDGIPLTIKDNIPVRGMPCSWGSRLLADGKPAERDETPVARLRQAGAVLLGKTNVPEFTLLGFTHNLVHGTTVNPWDLALTPGGSSGGAAAAVAAGIGPLALCTDGGGSIRRPASHCGLAGLKPGNGVVARRDGLPEILPDMEVIGPIARSVGDLAMVMNAIVFDPPIVPRHSGALRIARWRDIGGSPVDPEVQATLDDVAADLRAMGHLVIDASAPSCIEAFNQDAWGVVSATGLSAMLEPHAERLGLEATEKLLMPEMVQMWRTGRALSATALFKAQRVIGQLRGAITRLFDDVDMILTPSAAALPWTATQSHPTAIAGRDTGPRGHAVFTAFVNACGLPALALPAAPSRTGLPIGFQLVGPAGAEGRLLALGLHWEALRPWRDRWPEACARSGASAQPFLERPAQPLHAP